MDGQIGVLVQQHVVKAVKLEQGHAVFKDNAMINSKKLHIAIVVPVVCGTLLIILNLFQVKPIGPIGVRGPDALSPVEMVQCHDQDHVRLEDHVSAELMIQRLVESEIAVSRTNLCLLIFYKLNRCW